MKNNYIYKTVCAGLAVIIGLLLPFCQVRADEIATLTRDIMEKWQDAVIITRVVIEVYESERKLEGLATVIDPSGLAVISLSSIDPSSMYSTDAESKVKDIKLITADNVEIPAKIVLRDQDLDLAFVRPLEKLKKPLTAIDMKQTTTPEIMDHVVLLSRLGTLAGNASAVSLARIQAIIEKPRVMYMPDPFTGLVSGMGTPVFTLDGRVIGIMLIRTSKSRDTYSSEMAGGISGMGMLPIILPAEEIKAVMQRVPELKE